MKQSIKIAESKIRKALEESGVNFIRSESTSIYLKLDGVLKVKQIRFSDHSGHKAPNGCIQVRSDCETSRKKGIFNTKDYMQVVSVILTAVNQQNKGKLK